jgi:hypothetical protein
VFKIPHGFSKVSIHKHTGGVWSGVSACQIIGLCIFKIESIVVAVLINFSTDLNGGNRYDYIMQDNAVLYIVNISLSALEMVSDIWWVSCRL